MTEQTCTICGRSQAGHPTTDPVTNAGHNFTLTQPTTRPLCERHGPWTVNQIGEPATRTCDRCGFTQRSKENGRRDHLGWEDIGQLSDIDGMFAGPLVPVAQDQPPM